MAYLGFRISAKAVCSLRRAVLAWCCALPLMAIAPSPDPYRIYDAARQSWESAIYPRHVAYTIAVAVVEARVPKVEHYRAAYNAFTGHIWIDTVSDWEIKHPASGRGIDVSFDVSEFGIALNKPFPPVDFLGVPRLAPNYSFGMAASVHTKSPTAFDPRRMVEKIRAEYHDPARRPLFTPSPGATPGKPLRVIATVAAIHRGYTITYVGEERVNGHLCYHLKLMPRRSNRSPAHNRLRDLWIGEKTFTTWMMRVSANFTAGAPSGTPWTIRFRVVDGARYIASETAERAIARVGLIFTKAVIRFVQIRTTENPPLETYFAPGNTRVLTEPP